MPAERVPVVLVKRLEEREYRGKEGRNKRRLEFEDGLSLSLEGCASLILYHGPRSIETKLTCCEAFGRETGGTIVLCTPALRTCSITGGPKPTS